ncbi:EF-Tu/IF-2/RF-3 family GTPase [Streptomyces sp. EN27]|uniref:EF-Tu/IF-2/RF-3 family GTPase n=1 Tax=Streptomyces sp. EN27 TaxID=211464 RepID=UPI0008521B18|nr:EF-Tu/IF-2/RF-3 family GTPase [Streptomyces sp. EN27]
MPEDHRLNIFVVGLDEANLPTLRAVPGADAYRFHGLLTPEELSTGPGRCWTRTRGASTPIVSGTVEQGTIRRHETVEIVGLRDTMATIVTSSAAFSKGGDVCRAGDEAALLLRDIHEEEVGRGQVVAAPGSVRSHASFEADIDVPPREASMWNAEGA